MTQHNMRFWFSFFSTASAWRSWSRCCSLKRTCLESARGSTESSATAHCLTVQAQTNPHRSGDSDSRWGTQHAGTGKTHKCKRFDQAKLEIPNTWACQNSGKACWISFRVHLPLRLTDTPFSQRPRPGVQRRLWRLLREHVMLTNEEILSGGEIVYWPPQRFKTSQACGYIFFFFTCFKISCIAIHPCNL